MFKALTIFKKILAIPLSLFLFISVLSGCAVNPVTGEKELMLVSEAQEIEMGRSLYPNAIWAAEGGGGEFRDEGLKNYLRDIILKIHGVSHRPNLPVDFAIQNSSVPNAWAIPGHVVITRGLLAALDSEAEFAFVMGHEMGHVSARHSAKQTSYAILQQIGLAAAGAAVADRKYSDAFLTAGAIGSSLVLLKYSRSDELEADRLGLLYMTRLGYDPQGAISAHRNLEKAVDDYIKSIGKETREADFFGELLSTHPRTAVRIEELERMKGSMGPVVVKGDGTGRERFRDMVAGLGKTDRVYREYYDKAVRAYREDRFRDAEELVSRAIEADKDQPPFYALRGFIRLESKDYAAAAVSFGSALRIDAGYQPALRGMGAVNYMRGDYQEGVRYLKEALRIYPEDASSHYFLGMSYYKTYRYRDAAPHLKGFASAQPKHPEVHGALGVCYEELGDARAAYGEYLMQIRVAPYNEMGRLAARRAAVLKPIVERQRIKR
ncbi:MAG: M48 family metalloprotease [Deltaproteobacteria bacterium]|nr:M48 family metalloprotease [Deltaproteobacteria bacterium]